MKKAVSVFLAILCALSVLTLGVFAEGENQFPTSGEIGDQGDNVVWQFDTSTGKLTVSGTGKMKDFPWMGSACSPFDAFGDQILDVEIQSGVTSIGEGVFYSCEMLRSVQLPDTLREIGAEAFSDNRLKTVQLPDNLETIGDHAFYHCLNLTDFVVGNNCKGFCAIDGVLFTKDKSELVQYPVGNTRSSYTVPDGVKKLRDSSFYKALSLTKVALPDSLETIGVATFRQCLLLHEVKMPKTLQEMGWWAFVSCSALVSIVVPEGITVIADNTFNSCTLLRTISLPKSLQRIEHDAFYGCNLIGDIYYNGTAAEWDALDIEGQSLSFYTANMHFTDTKDTGFFARIQSTIRNLFNMIRRMFEAMFSFA